MNTRRMKYALSLLFAAAACAALLLPTPRGAAQSRAARPALVVRVGITEYQNVEDNYRRYEQLFRELSQAAEADKPITFEFAIGNYGEVLDWYNKGAIAVAILSAMPVADLLSNAGSGDPGVDDEAHLRDLRKIDEAYLGDVSVTKQPSDSPSEQRFFPSESVVDPFKYRTCGVVLNSDTDITGIEDVKRLWQDNKVKFLFVRPYSMSGYILPRAFLLQHGITPTAEQMEFTYQHWKSLEMMRNSAQPGGGTGDKHLVAFVLDSTTYTPPQGGSQKLFRRIEGMRELEDHRIPREILLANYNLEKNVLDTATDGYPNEFEKFKKIMSNLLTRWRTRTGGMKTVALDEPDGGKTLIDVRWRPPAEGWRDGYRELQTALNNTSLPRQLLYRSTLDELLDDLANEARRAEARRGRPPRLALVLSGGGAKCAYQAGAVVAVEKKLKRINEKLRREGMSLSKPLDIDLVVGTSGGAINALLVALGVTADPNAVRQMQETWQSFKQQQFFQPSLSFNLVFGLCFGLLQALLITVAVLLFGRQSMNWPATLLVLLFIGGAQYTAASYFQAPPERVWWLLGVEAAFVGAVIVTVLVFSVAIEFAVRRFGKRRKQADGAAVGEAAALNVNDTAYHWRRLTVALMIFAGLLECLIAKTSWAESLVTGPGSNHWSEHGWMLLTLVCNWAFPYPLIIGLAMALVGRVFWRNFDWNQRRESFVWWTAVVLLIFSGLLVGEAFFKEHSPLKVEGIERAFAQMIPELLRGTVKRDFTPPPPAANETPLETISRGLLAEGGPLLQRDLVITTSKLPQKGEEITPTAGALPDDLYFYFRHNTDERLMPPLDRRFVPFKYNREKLLDVVIGSSTIYPIFPSRTLKNVQLGNEEVRAADKIKQMKVVDGGFIHNIPIEAAGLWKASHVILINASPSPTQSEPLDFWDNVLTAFGYLFDQTQRTDKLARGGAETFELGPTSLCEKENLRPTCTGEDGQPEPDLDTFDFSPHLAEEAFRLGMRDALGLKSDADLDAELSALDSGRELPPGNVHRPHFARIAGPPLFRSVVNNTTAAATLAPTPAPRRPQAKR